MFTESSLPVYRSTTVKAECHVLLSSSDIWHFLVKHASCSDCDRDELSVLRALASTVQRVQFCIFIFFRYGSLCSRFQTLGKIKSKGCRTSTGVSAKCSVPYFWRPLGPWLDNHRASDAWPVRRQTYDYLPSCVTLPMPLGHYSFPISVGVGGWVGLSGW